MQNAPATHRTRTDANGTITSRRWPSVHRNLANVVTTNRGIIQVYLLKKEANSSVKRVPFANYLPNHAEKDACFPYPASGGERNEGSNSCPEEESHELRRADRNLWI